MAAKNERTVSPYRLISPVMSCDRVSFGRDSERPQAEWRLGDSGRDRVSNYWGPVQEFTSDPSGSTSSRVKRPRYWLSSALWRDACDQPAVAVV